MWATDAKSLAPNIKPLALHGFQRSVSPVGRLNSLGHLPIPPRADPSLLARSMLGAHSPVSDMYHLISPSVPQSEKGECVRPN